MQFWGGSDLKFRVEMIEVAVVCLCVLVIVLVPVASFRNNTNWCEIEYVLACCAHAFKLADVSLLAHSVVW